MLSQLFSQVPSLLNDPQHSLLINLQFNPVLNPVDNQVFDPLQDPPLNPHLCRLRNPPDDHHHNRVEYLPVNLQANHQFGRVYSQPVNLVDSPQPFLLLNQL